MHTTRDLTNLLQLMQTSRQSGNLTIEPYAQNETSWQGFFRLVDGQITSCLVRGKSDSRILFRGNDAVRWLISPDRGKLQWSLEEPSSPSDTFLPILPTKDSSEREEQSRAGETDPYPVIENNSHRRDINRPPQQAVYISGSYLNEQSILPGAILKRTELGNKAPNSMFSSRDLRQVFALVDGHRTVEEIVRLLHKPPDFVVRLLNELKAAKLLE